MRRRSIGKCGRMTKRGPMLAWLTIWLVCGCAGSGCVSSPKVVVIPADREVKRVKAGAEFRSAHDGWFVPDATWREMNAAIGRELNEGRAD